ncbi:reverse transcriptase domain-containing protein [Tanacetum coccineum]
MLNTDIDLYTPDPKQEAGGSSSGPIRRRRYIYREREEAEERLIDDYFGDDEYEPKYPEETFRRRVSGANNDLNVLYGSPLFDDEIADIAPECPFIVNGHTYRKCYYLADGIYPEWSTFVKTFSVTRDAKTFKFKTVQEAARKDIERAFRNLIFTSLAWEEILDRSLLILTYEHDIGSQINSLNISASEIVSKEPTDSCAG